MKLKTDKPLDKLAKTWIERIQIDKIKRQKWGPKKRHRGNVENYKNILEKNKTCALLN